MLLLLDLVLSLITCVDILSPTVLGILYYVFFSSCLRFDIYLELPLVVRLSLMTNEKDHHYFLNRFVCVGEFFDC